MPFKYAKKANVAKLHGMVGKIENISSSFFISNHKGEKKKMFSVSITMINMPVVGQSEH